MAMKNDMWLLMGWTETQWAIAIAVLKPEKTDISSLAHVKHEYKRRWNCDPGTVDFIGVERPKSWDWMAELMESGLIHSL